MTNAPRWTCCQIGAREHYSVPRALHRNGVLERLITELWVEPGSLLGRLNARLAQRHHAELSNVSVRSWNLAAGLFELVARPRSPDDWWLFMHRNEWFQRQALRELQRIHDEEPDVPRVLFSYSYAGRRLFEYAHSKGWATVLGQIDPGPPEEEIVQRVQQRLRSGAQRWIPAPQPYWRGWFEECELADAIVVNSEWSREALLREHITDEKIHVIPLAYEAPAEAEAFARDCPDSFSGSRPLRVLFLGQVNARKGMNEVMAAIRQLDGAPVVFDVVGPIQIEVPEDLRNHPQVRWHGAVPRAAVQQFFRDADVFLFPTHSDGFGMTQLEAQAWKLPVIASRFCGDVIHDGVNGLRLPEVTGDAVTAAVRRCLGSPATLTAWSAASGVDERFSINAIGRRYVDLAEGLYRRREHAAAGQKL